MEEFQSESGISEESSHISSAASSYAQHLPLPLLSLVDSAMIRLELLAERLGSTARPYIRGLPSDVGDGALGGLVICVFLWGSFSSYRMMAPTKPPQAMAPTPPQAEAPQAEAASAGYGGPLRALARGIDTRLDRYTFEIERAVFVARLLIGASLVAYGVAVWVGAISFQGDIGAGMSAEAAAETEATWRRFSSTAGVGVGTIVLLPALLPAPAKGAPRALHPADEILRS